MRIDRPQSIMQTMQTVLLPNGLEIFCLNKNEATWVHGEVKSYLKHGIQLHAGATVFDVGANIGVFTLYLNHLLENEIKVYSFEPIPPIFKVLEQNIQRYNSTGLKPFCCGLGRTAQSIVFDYYPEATVISGVAGQSSEGIQQLARDVLLHHPEHAPFPSNLLRWVPPYFRSLIFDGMSQHYFRAEQVTCEIRTLSEIVQQEQVAQIDLLKIDVEKSEMEVLMGIEAQDWQKIQQVVIEVHDVDHRLEQVVGLLKDHGLTQVIVEQEPLFQGSKTFNVYALRQAPVTAH